MPLLSALYFALHGAARDRGEADGLRGPEPLGWSGVVLLGGSVTFLAAAAGLLPFTTSAWLPRHVIPLGCAIVACHAIALAVDLRRGHAGPVTPLGAALYLLQFPLLIAGPIVRYHDFSAQLSDRAVSIGAAAYGVRRVVIGYIKVALLADGLGAIADPIFAAKPGALGPGAAWLGAVCAALQVYFIFSGYADFAIGLGRMFGFRYPENFRRPFTADSLREFWRRWNITLLTWLRDYAGLPIAGQDRPTPLLFIKLIAGFAIVGWWHGAGATALVWAVFAGSLLAFEAALLGRALAGWPVVARHGYVLLAVTVGWVIARADSLSGVGAFLEAMLGVGGAAVWAGAPAVGWFEWSALAAAVLIAGPLIPSVSRWRVSVDAATTSAVMMLAATAVFLWKPILRWGQTRVRPGSERGQNGVRPR